MAQSLIELFLCHFGLINSEWLILLLFSIPSLFFWFNAPWINKLHHIKQEVINTGRDPCNQHYLSSLWWPKLPKSSIKSRTFRTFRPNNKYIKTRIFLKLCWNSKSIKDKIRCFFGMMFYGSSRARRFSIPFLTYTPMCSEGNVKYITSAETHINRHTRPFGLSGIKYVPKWRVN